MFFAFSNCANGLFAVLTSHAIVGSQLGGRSAKPLTLIPTAQDQRPTRCV